MGRPPAARPPPHTPPPLHLLHGRLQRLRGQRASVNTRGGEAARGRAEPSPGHHCHILGPPPHSLHSHGTTLHALNGHDTLYSTTHSLHSGTRRENTLLHTHTHTHVLQRQPQHTTHTLHTNGAETRAGGVSVARSPLTTQNNTVCVFSYFNIAHISVSCIFPSHST